MSGKDRLALFPSRANAVYMKQRVLSAVRGLGLLKKKRDAIELKLRELNAEIHELSQNIPFLMMDGLSSLARARYHGIPNVQMTSQLPNKPRSFCEVGSAKVVGITILKFAMVVDDTNEMKRMNLTMGGRDVDETEAKFTNILKLLVSIGSLKFAILNLEIALKQNNTRLNGIEFVVIPKYKNTLAFILNELEENEREDFYRLKCSKKKQMKARKALTDLVQGVVPKTADDKLEPDIMSLCPFYCGFPRIPRVEYPPGSTKKRVKRPRIVNPKAVSTQTELTDCRCDPTKPGTCSCSKSK